MISRSARAFPLRVRSARFPGLMLAKWPTFPGIERDDIFPAGLRHCAEYTRISACGLASSIIYHSRRRIAIARMTTPVYAPTRPTLARMMLDATPPPLPLHGRHAIVRRAHSRDIYSLQRPPHDNFSACHTGRLRPSPRHAPHESRAKPRRRLHLRPGL